MKCPFIFGTLIGILILAEGAVRAQGEGDKYVLDALQTLLTLRSVECDVRVETLVADKEYAAWGHYAEQVLPQVTRETFLRSVYRLELNFVINSPTANDIGPNQMTLVCHASNDGQTHRIDRYTSIEGVKSFSTVDLKKLEDRLKMLQREVFFRQASEVRNLGGLAGKMRQISRFYEFSLPTQENLQNEETIPTLKLTGTLRSIYHKELLEKFGGLDKKGRYPPEFPSDIEIWLGQLDDFPYKIRYLRRTSEKSEQKTLIFQESFYSVVVNGPPIPDAKFAPLKEPDDVFQVSDETEDVLRALGL